MPQTDSIGAPSRHSSSAAPASRAVLRAHSNGIQHGCTPGTVAPHQIRAAEIRKAQSWRTRLIKLIVAEPCPYREGFAAPESSDAECAVTFAAGVATTALSLIAIFLIGGAA